MAYYSRSSLAYDFTLFEEPQDNGASASLRGKAKDKSAKEDGGAKQNSKTKSEKNARSSAKRARGGRSNVGRIVLGVVLALMMAFVVVSIIHGQVQLTELNQEIADAKQELAEQQSVYTQLQMKVDSSVSTTVVEDYAKNKLDMTKATNSQKEFVNLSDKDKAEVTLSADKNIFESIAEAVSSLWS